MRAFAITALGVSLVLAACTPAQTAANEEWTPLFNGTDLSGWKVPEGDNGHWKVVDGVIDYDARSEAKGKKDLWTDRDFQDFTLRFDWKLKEYAGPWRMYNVLPDGSHERDAEGKPIETMRPNVDGGIYLRGSPKAQINLWAWPIGSGEVWGYRTDGGMPAEVRAGVTPKLNADNPVGEWNTAEVTMVGDLLTVVINGKTVIEKAQLPGIPASGPIGLQHHGGIGKDGKLIGASSLVQFRNISIHEL